MRQAYDRPDIHNCELSGNVSERNSYETVYVQWSSGVYLAHELNPGEEIDRILLHIARLDFEQSYEPCRETTPERSIHILPPACIQTELFRLLWLRESRSPAHRALCMS